MTFISPLPGLVQWSLPVFITEIGVGTVSQKGLSTEQTLDEIYMVGIVRISHRS